MTSPAWRFATASVAGTSHERDGTPCQDSHLAELAGADHSVLILIASDGAGSASHSHEGSSLACRTLADLVRTALDGGLEPGHLTRDHALQWLRDLQTALQAAADHAGLGIRDFACTLLAAIISPTHAAFLQVGDGAIVVRPDGDSWSYIFWPQHGQFINTTHFITDPAAGDVLEFDVSASRIEEIAVFTDGIESLVLHFASQTVHAPFFDRMFVPVRALPGAGPSETLSGQLGTYLTSPLVSDRTDDDKTLLLATRIPGTSMESITAEATCQPNGEDSKEARKDDSTDAADTLQAS